jgi:hypothetical protein
MCIYLFFDQLLPTYWDHSVTSGMQYWYLVFLSTSLSLLLSPYCDDHHRPAVTSRSAQRACVAPTDWLACMRPARHASLTPSVHASFLHVSAPLLCWGWAAGKLRPGEMRASLPPANRRRGFGSGAQAGDHAATSVPAHYCSVALARLGFVKPSPDGVVWCGGGGGVAFVFWDVQGLKIWAGDGFGWMDGGVLYLQSVLL